jgi:hypothetical protein
MPNPAPQKHHEFVKYFYPRGNHLRRALTMIASPRPAAAGQEFVIAAELYCAATWKVRRSYRTGQTSISSGTATTTTSTESGSPRRG